MGMTNYLLDNEQLYIVYKRCLRLGLLVLNIHHPQNLTFYQPPCQKDKFLNNQLIETCSLKYSEQSLTASINAIWILIIELPWF